MPYRRIDARRARAVVSFRLRAFVAAAALFAIAPAVGVSFDYADTPEGVVDFAPWHFVLDANGAWALGNAQVRYAADGSVTEVTVGSYANGLLIETADGGFVTSPIISFDPQRTTPCSVRKHGQWFLYADTETSCDSLASDGGGTLWITTRAGIDADPVSVYRVGIDGVGLAGPIALPANFVALALAASKADGSYVAGYDSVASHPSVVALDASGGVRWQFVDTTGNGRFTQIGVDPAGNVRTAGEAADNTLVVAGIDAAGHTIGVVRANAPGADRTSGLAIAADGSSFNDVPSTDGTHRVLESIGADEALLGQFDIPVQGRGSYSSEIDGHAGIRIAANNDILVLADAGNGSTTSTTLTLVRFNSAGSVLSTAAINEDTGAEAIYASSMAPLPDSSALLSVYTANGLPNSAGNPPPNGRFVRIDASGQLVAGPYPTANVVPASLASVASLISADGTTYLLSNNALEPLDPLASVGATSRVALSAISPAGALLWKVDADGYWAGATLALGGDRICISGNFAPVESDIGYDNPDVQPDTRVECHDTASGLVTSTATLLPASATPPLIEATQFAADGTLATVYAVPDMSGQNSNGIEIATLDTSGDLVATHTIDSDATIFAACDDGSFALVANDANVVVTRVGHSGDVTSSITLPTANAQYFSAHCLDDGSLLLEGQISDIAYGVTLLAPDDTLRWSQTLAPRDPLRGYQFGSVASDGTSLYIAFAVSMIPHGGALTEPPTVTSKATRLDRSTGAVSWSTDLEESSQNGVVVDPTNGKPVYYAVQNQLITLHVLDAASGAVASTFLRACNIVVCYFTMGASDRVRIDDDGTLRYVLGSLGGYAGDVPHVVAIDAITSTPAIAIAQPSLSGIWYAPYASGQGFTIDVAPGGTIFMPWFTYAPHLDRAIVVNDLNDPSLLNWYSLQGAASNGDTSAPLTIYSNTGGTFVSGVTTAEPVGSATLSFRDCAHGQLEYQFNAGASPAAGLTGTIDIVRLTQQIGDCVEPGGATTAGAPARANDGFDTKQSGAWYDRSTGGQGVEFSILPPSSGSAGLLFGAWFTYDPAGHSDDPTKQRWFTLQADFASASNGSVVVPIYSTLGGRFDDVPGRTTLRIGQGTLTFDACSSATFAYQFDNTVMAGAYRSLGGTLHLAPLTACSP